MYDEIVKEKIDQVVPDTPEDNMAKKASSWASQSVRKHLMGIVRGWQHCFKLCGFPM